MQYIYYYEQTKEGFSMKVKNINLQPGTLLAELIGTFILTTVAITVANPIIVGFTLLVLVLTLGSVSGAHLNPAISFGLWSVRKLEAIKLPFYWAMQLVGALLALLLSQMYQGTNYGISFASFNNLDAKILIAELVGTAVFAFAFAAAWERKDINSAKALAVGLALLTGLAVGGGLLGQAAQAPAASTKEAGRITKIDGAVLNPAIAFASTERADQQGSLQSLTGQPQAASSTKRPASRLTWETVLGGLVGGAVGMNLFMVTAGINPLKRESATKEAVVTRLFNKGKKK